MLPLLPVMAPLISSTFIVVVTTGSEQQNALEAGDKCKKYVHRIRGVLKHACLHSRGKWVESSVVSVQYVNNSATATNIDVPQVNLVTNSIHVRIWKSTLNIVLQLIILAIANHTGYTHSSIM